MSSGPELGEYWRCEGKTVQSSLVKHLKELRSIPMLAKMTGLIIRYIFKSLLLWLVHSLTSPSFSPDDGNNCIYSSWFFWEGCGDDYEKPLIHTFSFHHQAVMNSQTYHRRWFAFLGEKYMPSCGSCKMSHSLFLGGWGVGRHEVKCFS